MPSNLSSRETALILAALALAAFGLWGPFLPQPPDQHGFADRRVLVDLPFALDVLSSLAFAMVGAVGLRMLAALPPQTITNMQRAMAVLFFAGLLLTAAGSAWYHWDPDDAGLAVQRTAMATAWAGLLGFAVATHVSERAAAATGLLLLVLGPLAVKAWSGTGNLLPWTTLQAGAMALVVWLALLRRRFGAPDVHWGGVILAFVAAKLFDMADHDVYHLSDGLVAGHALQHLAAAAAAWPVIAALAALRPQPQRRAFATVTRVTSTPLGDA